MVYLVSERGFHSDVSSVLLRDQVTTVDRYQGQQNDYIILSLVRTKTVGHIRDVRRLVVAMSRARLGLYVLARVSLFRNCFELRPTFSQVSVRNGFVISHVRCVTDKDVTQRHRRRHGHDPVVTFCHAKSHRNTR